MLFYYFLASGKCSPSSRLPSESDVLQVENDKEMDFFNNDMVQQMKKVAKRKESEGQFWENEIREMNRWYQM